MSFRQGTEEYYQKFIELQEKLRKSEEERLKLEMKFNEMVQHSRDEEQAYYHKLRSNYKQFLEENKKRQERNDKILRLLERIESRAAVLEAKTQRFKYLRRHYQNYLDFQSRSKPIQQNKPHEKLGYDLKLPETESKEELLKKYFDQLDSVKSRYSSDKATAIADDIMNAIYKKNKCSINDDHQKYSMDRFEGNNKYFDNNNQTRLRNQNVNFNLQQTNPALRTRENYCGTDRLNKRDNLPTNRYPLSNYSSDESGGDVARQSSVHPNKSSELDKFAVDLQNFHSLLDSVKIDEKDIKEQQVEIFDPDQFKTKNKTKNEMMDNNGDVIYKNGEDIVQETEEIVVNKDKELIRGQSPLIDQHDDKNPILETSEMNVDVAEENNEENMEIQNSFKIKNDQFSKEAKKELQEINNEQNVKDNADLLLNQSASSPKLNGENHDNNIDETSEVINNDVNLNNENGDEPQDNKHLEKNAVEDMEYTQNDELLDETGKNNVELSQFENNENATYNDKLQLMQTSNQLESNENNYDQAQFLVDGQQTAYDENGQPIQYDENGQQIGYDSTQVMQPVQYESNVLPTQFDNNEQPIQYDNSGEPVQYDGQLNQYDTQQYDANALQCESNTQQYDANGQPIKYEADVQQYDANGEPLQYESNTQQYDANGQPIKYEGDVQQYDANGQPLQFEDNAQEYDANGQPIKYEGDIQQYDTNGQPIQYENGQPLQMQPLEYDANNQPIQYDENGQPIPYGNNEQVLQYDENSQAIQYDDNGQPIQFGDNVQPQYDENSQPIQYDENGQPIQYDENGQPIHYDQYGRQIHYDESGQAFLYDETGNLIPYTDYSEDRYAKDEASVLNSEIQPETTDISAVESSDNTTFGGRKDQDDEKKLNVLDLLETDSESKKQEDSTKISNESDFEFSNNS